MWWMFKKLSEAGSIVMYAYSRENHNLDGRISINRDTEDIVMVQPSEKDKSSAFSRDKALQKAWWMIKEGYPDSRQIACG